ncbi:homeobox protein SEBOX-like [Peromyscus eremicus]|uniref:homeobox protein SEBOX-like n=1 Tax=Peromyscus eremicus TaxID=42410 RepID=UPI0027DDEC89|nr:homeobox protein SEBOX-like [Peromyscus eremicus]
MAHPFNGRAPYTPDPLDRDFSWEQLWELERQFKLEPYPDLEARRVLATRLNLKEEQVETWFIQRSLEQEMRPRIARLQQSVRPNTSSCESHKAHCCRPPSWRFRLIPINSSESSSSCEHKLTKMLEAFQRLGEGGGVPSLNTWVSRHMALDEK